MSPDPRFVLVTPVLAWPPDQGSRRLQLEVARALRTLGEVAWVTRCIGPQREARERLVSVGFTLDLDLDFVRQDAPARLARRLRIDLRALRSGRPRALAFTATPRVRALARTRRQQWPGAVSVGVYWTVWPAIAEGAPGSRALILSDVEQQVLADGRRLAGPAGIRDLRRLQTAEREAFQSCDRLLCLTQDDVAAVRRVVEGSSAMPATAATAIMGGRAPTVGLWPATIPVPEQPSPPRARAAGEPLRLLTYGHWEAAFNRDGLDWFLRETWPALRTHATAPRLRVVGAGLGAALARLVSQSSADAVGWVDDLSAELAACDAVVIPLRYAGGLRYRLLEAMAGGRPAICTPVAARGCGATPGVHFLQADSPPQWQSALLAVADAPRARALAVDAHRLAAESYANRGLRARLLDALGPLLTVPPSPNPGS